MIRSIVILLSISLLTGYACSSLSGNKDPQEKAIEELLDSLVQPYIDSSKIAGLAIGVAQNDTIIFLKSYGYADLVFDIPLPASASFEIGSVTKQFTSVAIMQLVDKGLLSLDDNLKDYVSFDTKGRTVTIEQLMNHTSGIKGFTEMPSFENLSVYDYPRDTLLRIVEKKDFDFEPGDAMIYNNTAYFMLGLIIEKVTGQSYEEYVSENIFSPADMSNSYYGDERKIVKNKAYGYDTDEEGKLLKAEYLDHTWPYSAGSLCSTIEDLLKWNHTLHTTETILNRELYAELISPSELMDGTRLRYAKGLLVDKYNGTDVISHGGGINGFLSDSRYFPEHGLAIVTLINSTGPIDPVSISNVVTDLLIPGQEKDPDLEYEGDITMLPGTYAGRTRGRDIELRIDEAEQKLILKFNGQNDTLGYDGNNRWIVNGDYCSFHKDNGQVIAIHIDQGYGYYILQKLN